MYDRSIVVVVVSVQFVLSTSSRNGPRIFLHCPQIPLSVITNILLLIHWQVNSRTLCYLFCSTPTQLFDIRQIICNQRPYESADWYTADGGIARLQMYSLDIQANPFQKYYGG